MPTLAHAALLYLESDSVAIHRGDTTRVTLRLDTDDAECVNVVSAAIKYEASIQAVDVSTGSSILNVWVEEPRIDRDTQTITFAGGIPGGYCGRIPGDPSLTNVLLEVIFQSPGLQIGGGASSESARIWIEDTAQVLQHNEEATPAVVRTQDTTIALLPTPNAAPSDPWRAEVLADTEPPADFSITLTRDESAFSGQYFIVFNSTDKQSGINHYEVMEEPFEQFGSFSWGGVDAPWVRTTSPYVLTDQTLNSTIRVKAVDKAGNERIVHLVPDTALRGMSQTTILLVLAIAGIIILIGGGVAYRIWRRNLVRRVGADET
jgi:hypothetical protein